MNKRNIFTRLIAVAAAAALLTVFSIPVYADSLTTDTGTGSVNGSVTINGTILPLTISVTHPVTVDYTIDPNAGTITAAPITVKNDTKVPVNITVQSLSSTSGGTLEFTDVAPDAESWNTLTCAESKKYIALGVGITDGTGWNAGYSTATDWAASKTPVQVGSLASGATGSLSLTAKNGLAFDNTYTAKANLVFMVNLV